VWRRAVAAERLDRLVVATDDERIAAAARAFGAEVMLTSPSHPSGTDRVAEVAERTGGDHEIVVNVQGDEPLLTPTSLDRLVTALERAEPEVGLSTLAEPIEAVEELFDPNVVKVVTALDGRALYFSRSPIPFWRRGAVGLDFRAALDADALRRFRKHQGIYAYRRAVLAALAAIAPGPLESAEGLEQLRALETGRAIVVVDSDFRSIGVDTPADLERAARRIDRTRSLERGAARG
jgi:3-deoxy-manno-octulosonate cytidylyltransferase (CMP-KDO synthetase)